MMTSPETRLATCRAVAVVALTCLSPLAAFAADEVSPVLAAYQVTNVVVEEVRAESNAEIMASKRQHDLEDLGSMVYLYLRNPGETAFLKGISWAGKDVEAHAAGPDYQAIWWRLTPHLLGGGEEGELAICLRNRLAESTEFTVELTNGQTITQVIEPEGPPFRFGSIGFGPELKRIYLYVEKLRADAPLPERIHAARVSVEGEPRWLSPGYVGGVRAAVIEVKRPLRRGRHCTFRVTGGGHSAGATVRAFTDLARFGSYGYPGRLGGYAANGLNAYAQFGPPDKGLLDRAQELGIKVAGHLNYSAPSDHTFGHPALYAYMGMDEPDVRDYGEGDDRPMHLRIGTTAMRTLRAAQLHTSRDPLTPTLLTINLTFTPRNYFVYGPMADIANPDCYPIAIDWSVRAVRDKLSIAKRASAPRVLTYTYQNMWEEWARPDTPMPWMGFAHIQKIEDSTTLVDRKRRRGFARAPAPQEVRLGMLYGIGCGARGLLGYHDGSELAAGGLILHGTWVLPEIWKVNGETIRALRMIAPLIDVSHPMTWARSDAEQVWVRTLIGGDRAAVVVAVNEDYESVEAGFTEEVAKNVRFRFDHWPWLEAKTVLKVGDGGFVRVASQHDAEGLSWTETQLADGEMYLVVADAAVADQLEKRYQETAPFATDEGRSKPEHYLKGRRTTPKPPVAE